MSEVNTASIKTTNYIPVSQTALSKQHNSVRSCVCHLA